MKDVKALINDYLGAQKLMQLASVSESGPWVCSVWQVSDEDMNIYFFSSTTRRHSKEIVADGRVAGALAKPHLPGGPGAQAIQFEGVAEIIENDQDYKKARTLFEQQIFDADTIDRLINHPDKPHKFYKITPSKFVLFDTINFPDESRQEITL